VLLLSLARPCAAATEDQIEFEIGQCQDSLCAWINLSDLLTSSRVARLKEGVPVAIECRCTVVRPRRLWGHEKIIEADWRARLIHRPVTEDFLLESTNGGEVVLSSLARLHRYLADSVTVMMLPMDSLDKSTSYRLKVNLALTWLTVFNVSPTTDETGSPGSILRFLFGNFLEVSGYGREELELEGNPFTPGKLRIRDE
jgi:hypothetical protein